MTLFADAFKGRRVLITGHTGFKGAWLTVWLLRLGAEVLGYSRDVPTTPSLFEQAGLAERIDHRIGDIRDTAELERTLVGFRPDFVFHMAAQAIVSAGYSDPLGTVMDNVFGACSVLQALRALEHSCAVIIVASDKCYENLEQPWGYREIDELGGKDVYSASKGAAEIMFRSFQRSFFADSSGPVRMASVRAGNVIGGGDWAADRIVADCIRAWSRDEPILLRRPEAVRPWQHVLEPLSGYLTLAAQLAQDPTLHGESFNFGPLPGPDHTVMQLLGDLAHTWGRDAEGSYRVAERPPFAEAGLLSLSVDKARARLRWEATLSYAETVQFTGGWYRDVHRRPDEAMQASMAQIDQYETLARDRARAWALD